MAKSCKIKSKTSTKKEESTRTVHVKPINDKTERSLDTAQEASATVRELNNVILKLKPLVKQAKARTIQKLVRNIQKFKKTKGSVENVEKARTKAERLLDEIYTIKSLPQEHVAQYALGNTTSFFHISSQVDTPVEIKSMTRIAENPKIREYVQSFRKQHPDWEKLGDFMLFKQSGRRYKHATSENRVERIKASEALVKTYIDKKFSGDKAKLKKVEVISNLVIKPDSRPNSLKTKQNPKTEILKTSNPQKRRLFSSIAASQSDDKDDNNMMELKGSARTQSKSLNATKKDSEGSESESSSEVGESESDSVLSTKQPSIKITKYSSGSNKMKLKKSVSNKSSEIDSDSSDHQGREQSDGNESDSQLKAKSESKFVKIENHHTNIKVVTKKSEKKKPVISERNESEDSDSDFVIKKNKEMVVRKIDWDNFGIGADIRPLVFHHTEPVKKAKRKSDFFEASDGEYDDGSDGIKDDDVEIKDTDKTRDDQGKGYGRSLIESAFVKNLAGSGPQKKTQRYKERTKMEIQVNREIKSKQKSNLVRGSKPKRNYGNQSATKNNGNITVENVHPSWAASIKRKQEQGMISAFQGKKIKFD